MAHHQQDQNRRQSAIQSLLKMFNLSNTPTVPSLGEDDASGEADEPPDDQISPLQTCFRHKDNTYLKSASMTIARRESLLTRALHGESNNDEHSTTPISSSLHRGMSSTSSHSAASFASTAELTSDGGISSPARTETPSPPLPPLQYNHLPIPPKASVIPPPRIAIATTLKVEKPVETDMTETKVEATLGRKRRIMFACGRNISDQSGDSNSVPKEPERNAEPPKRKCMLKFACPVREAKGNDLASEVLPKTTEYPFQPHRNSSTSMSERKSSSDSVASAKDKKSALKVTSAVNVTADGPNSANTETSPTTRFHEFASSHDEADAWVNKANEHRQKLTLTDCMRKENAIRQIGKEAEEEAEQEEQEQEELDIELDDAEAEDDFAPSDESDAGNESDNEEGFADSDDESDAGSEYQFWAPSSSKLVPGADQTNQLRPFGNRLHSVSSNESLTGEEMPRRHISEGKYSSKRRPSKLVRMRPGTPELPDSTDFVCGTLDEDRPLEAAYISCREQRKLEKHIPIPQDIDPSFPTSDFEDDDDDDDDLEGDDQLWLKDQLDGFDEEAARGRRGNTATKKSPQHSPRRLHSPAPKHVLRRSPPPPRPFLHRSPPPKKVQPHRSPPQPNQRLHRSPPPRQHLHRSPPPPMHHLHRSPPLNELHGQRSPLPPHNRHRSPPPRRLFGHSPARLQTTPTPMKLKSPPGTRRPSFASSPTAPHLPLGITVSRLAQRPHMTRTASLPQTPNPFFRNYRTKSPLSSSPVSGAVTPGTLSEVPGRDMHVRGPVDIVVGLEKKRQKRKEMIWLQHCRKAAKEQAERKPIPGRGAVRMKELGLECAERNKGYGLGQPAPLIISL